MWIRDRDERFKTKDFRRKSGDVRCMIYDVGLDKWREDLGDERFKTKDERLEM